MASQDTPNSVQLVEDLVSVIVPAYNCEQYLRQCIDSIIEQSYKNIEIILVDDGSTDNTGEICDAYAVRDKRIRVIHTKNNGPAAARNIAIRESEGSLIFFLDADDFVERNAVNVLIEEYRRTKADIVAGDFRIRNHKGDSTDTMFLCPSNRQFAKQDIIDYVRSYLKKPTGYSLLVYVWGKLFRSSIIKDNNIYFDTDLRVFEDISFNFEYLKFARSACYVKNHIYTYCVHDNYASAGAMIYDNPVGYKESLKSIGEFLKSNGVDINIIKREIGHACISFTIRTMVRFFAINGNVSLKRIYKLIFNMVNDSDVRQSLQFYSPSKGESRILPVLMKFKLIRPIMLVCK
jgi:glycosyltransferase EpsJ